MIQELCEIAFRSTQRPVCLLGTLPGRRPVSAVEITPFFGRITANDQNMFRNMATCAMEAADEDIRSNMFSLRAPFEAEGATIRALRLKGIYPKVNDEGIVWPYTQGAGFSYKDVSVTDTGKIVGHTRKDPDDFDSCGTVKLSCLLNEISGAISLGPKITDPLLGFGTYDGISYNEQPVGFLVYGTERTGNTRLKRFLIQQAIIKGSAPDA